MPSLSRDIFREFQSAIDGRLQLEAELAELSRQSDPELQAAQNMLRATEEQQARERSLAEEQFATGQRAIADECDDELEAAQQELDSQVREIVRSLDTEAADLERLHADSAWVVSSVLDDDSDDSPGRQHERLVASVARTRDEQELTLAAARARIAETADERNRSLRERTPQSTDARTPEDLHASFLQSIQLAETAAGDLKRLLLPRLFLGWRPVWLTLSVLAGSTAAIYFAVDPSLLGIAGGRLEVSWLGTAAAIGGGVALVVIAVLYTFAAMAQSEVFQRWEQSLADAAALAAQWRMLTDRDIARREPEVRKQQSELESRREQTLSRYQLTYQQRLADIRQRREEALRSAHDAARRRNEQAARNRDSALVDIQQRHETERERRESDAALTLDHLKSRIADRLTERQRQQSAVWSRLKTGWERSSADFFSAVDADRSLCAEQFVPWHDLAEAARQRPQTIPDGIRIGHYAIDLADWPSAISNDMRLAPRVSRIERPAVLPFPDRLSLLLKSRSAAGREAALPILQTAMLRMLTLLPPGTLRFTLLDPVGLGDSFAGFMHLADFDEQLVTSRIWTETSQIEARLADLTEHMENVLQTYLRNEFPTLEDYNRHAGEVAEPYRLLVIRDFPAKFSEIAARRLTSIMTSGPRCGVYTLLSLDGKLQLPNNFHLADIEPAMNVFEWRSPQAAATSGVDWLGAESARDAKPAPPPEVGTEPAVDEPAPAFHSTDITMRDWPLVPESPPDPETFSQIVRQAGAASKGARRVEVAFERIAPPAAERWSGDSRRGLDVPMGRAGAVKLQHVRLGQGTSQHMLIAGKTGSGKSTFLHGLITNLALHYSPDELQFFLIDFKKGVEFKDYATFELPHARVIAIESDREFGVSALIRLDELMQERGELFRRHGVQDVAGFRQAQPQTPLPRMLLVIDEFQEFFVEDDKYAQTSALLLDRLVRQGRAFGVHVVLGSQTLGGAYSLARSTLGQVAVRVALQCSEADAHLILSEENTAARLLTRPGEAIYNDANGLVEGNHPFQIAWLPDDKREHYLREMRELALRRGLSLPQRVVFEGNLPSDLASNRAVQRLLSGNRQESWRPTAPRIWLGDAVEIGEPTFAALERQASSNILAVGQDADAIQGMFTCGALALALQAAHLEDTSRDGNDSPPWIWLFDGSAADDPVREVWARLEQTLGPDLRIVRPAQSPEAVSMLEAERQRRDAARDESGPSVVVFIYNLGRFRELRKTDDDFGFSSYGGQDKPPSTSRQFSQLLATGADLGLHLVVWADSYNTVDRWLSRQALRDFELRVLFPMNAADSSNLIDSPLASRLGPGRALLYREDRGSTEKFRPYAIPSDDLQDVTAQVVRGVSTIEVATDLEDFSVT